MAMTDLLFEMLKTDLSVPRMLLEQVTSYIRDQYGFQTADLPTFFKEKFPQLEDYEVDLIFSPQFTPGEHNRLEYIPILGEQALLTDEIIALKRRLQEADLYVEFKTADGMADVACPVHEVFIDRYVNLLHLDHALPDASVYAAILSDVPQESHNEVNLLAREEIWRGELRRDILLAFLKVFHEKRNFAVQKVQFLTNFVRTYRPGSLLDVERQLQSLIDSCEQDMENVAGRGFHDEYLKAMHAGGRLNLGEEAEVFEHYKVMMDMAARLKEDGARIPEVCPERWQRAREHQPV